jgi:acetyl esterase/lipase
MQIKLILLTLSTSFLWIASALAKDGKVGPTIKGVEHMVYKEASGSKLVLNVFYPEGHDTKKDKRPAIVFFFGGGWSGGNPAQFAPHCEYLASRGMVAMSADYRVRSRQGTPPFECVKDGKSAIRWIRQNAKKLGIDPERLAAGGGSAGGHVAAAIGTVPGLEEEGEDLSISSKPDALVLFNPVYDNGPKGYGHSRVADRYKEISPIHNIRKGTPPAIVFLGDQDSLIPVSTAEKYKALMEKVGSRSDLHVYAGQPHGFFNQGKKGNYYEKTVLEMDKFLISLGWLKGKPTIQVP